MGLSGGLINIWNGSLFSGTISRQSSFQITVKLLCNLSGHYFYVSNIYGPCQNENRTDFFDWLDNIDASQMDHWILTGDFNLIRSPHDRNRSGGDANNMLRFNSILQQLDLVEIPLKGRNFTWSNMQDLPLLEKLDWIFTSANWSINFPNTLAYPLARVSSDHIPIHIQIGSDIPKASIFRFENY